MGRVGRGLPTTSTHLFLKELLTMALSTKRSPTCDGPRKWNISMALSVGWAWHRRLWGQVSPHRHIFPPMAPSPTQPETRRPQKNVIPWTPMAKANHEKE